MPRVAAVVFVLASLAVLATCTGDASGPVTPVPAQLALYAGNGQTGTAGTPLPQPLVALVTAADGTPAPGLAVTWRVTAGGGSLSTSSASTDSLGHVAVQLTLGTQAGVDADSVLAIVGQIPAALVFTASATPAAPAQIALVSGDDQTGTVGLPLADSLVVVVRDVYGNATGGVSIDWVVTAGAGSLSASSATTNVAGRAAVAWTLGTAAGKSSDSATATIGGLAGSPVRFGADANPGPASALVLVAGNDQTGTVGAALTDSLVVVARDQFGNAVSGAPVSWLASAGGTSASMAPTSATGRSAVSWTLGTAAGGQQATATLPGAAGSPLPFNAFANPGPATHFAFTVQPSSPFQGSAITPAVVVTAQDAQGNTATGFTGNVVMTLGSNPASGSLSGTMTVAAVAGVATFADLRIDSAGTGYTIQAAATGLTPAVSSSFEVVPVSQFTRLAFTAQPTDVQAGSAIAPAVTVTAVDHLGNPATGFSGSVTIALAANPAAGTLGGTLSAIAVAGVATFADLRLDKRGAGYRLRASSAGLVPDTSDSFTVRAGPAARITVQGGDGQTGAAGTALPTPYSVQAVDRFDNPVTGATVAWTITAGGGGVNPPQSVTDSTGHASTTRTLGVHEGTQTVAGSVVGLADSVAPFTATATPNGTISGKISLATGFLAPPATTTSTPAGQTTTEPTYTPDELIVTYRSASLAAPPIGSVALAAPATAAALGRTIHERLAASTVAARFEIRGVSPALLAARVRVLDSTQLDALATTLRQDPAVGSVERNAILHLEAHRSAAATETLPGDPLYPRQAWHYGLIDLPRAWTITTGSAGVLVAVVDNGIRYDHPAVAANLTHDGYDFVSTASVKLCSGGTINNAGDGDGYDADPTQPADYDYNTSKNCAIGLTTSGNHGLHVAGTIGATGNDGVGVTGVNWTVRIRPVRVLGVAGFGTFYDIAQGILYAAGLPADNGTGGTVTAPSGARIINLSLGGSSGSTALHNAVIAATNAGALVVAAAGNSGNTSLLYPAAYPEALSVSAVGPDGLLASYSSYGSTIDIAAPGGDITDGGSSFGVLSSAWNYVTNMPIYDSWDGTSMATPHVSGVAALVLAQDPSLTQAQLRARLTTYAVDAGAAGSDDRYGAGIVNARNSLTQTLAPPAQPYARLYASSGLLLGTTAVAADGSYAFTGLDDGSYLVFGGTDESGDGQLGVPGRLWGALGGSVTPSAVTVDGAATYPATFAVALPTEQESNGSLAQANTLVVGGWVNGTIGSLSDADWFRVRIAQAGIYTFETSAVNGACGFALEANTFIALEDSTGAVLASNDDIDAAALNYCSRITTTLAPGAYVVQVQGHTPRRYRLSARSGS